MIRSALLPAAVATLALSAAPAHAATCDTTFTGPASTAWTNAASWSAGVPTAAEVACIPAGAGPVDVTLDATAKRVEADGPVVIHPGTTLSLTDSGSGAAHTSVFTGLTVNGTLTTAGGPIELHDTVVVNGAIKSTSPSQVALMPGTLSGTGQIDPPFVAQSGGTVSPGGEGTVGTLTFGSVYSQADGSTLDADLASDTVYDHVLAPNNDVYVGGTIAVTRLGGYTPSVDRTWDIIQGLGSMNLGWKVTPAPFAGRYIPGGVQLYMTDPLPDPTPTPTVTTTPVPTVTDAPAPMTTPAAATPTATPAPAALPAAVQTLLLGCRQARIVLEDVVQAGRRVRLDGFAATVLAGQTVRIRFAGGKTVATATVGTDGAFTATAPLPAKALRSGNRARYTAVVGADRSRDLKLARRLVLGLPQLSAGKVVLAGRVLPPLTRTPGRVTVTQETRCGERSVVAHFVPRRDGRFHVSVPAPSGGVVAVYRLASKVRGGRASDRAFNTFSLPLPALAAS